MPSPLVPGETVVITAAVVAASGGLSVVLVFMSAWIGAFVGDSITYLLGAKVGRPAARRLFTGKRSKRVFAWAYRQLEERGVLVVIAARMIPGGRTAVTFSSGLLRMRWRRFALAALVGGAIWAAYATALGWLGGEAFRQSFWKPLVIALGLAGVVALVGELVRRVSEKGAIKREWSEPWRRSSKRSGSGALGSGAASPVTGLGAVRWARGRFHPAAPPRDALRGDVRHSPRTGETSSG